MFAPDHAKRRAEMARVCRPGGRIGLANWTPEGFIGQLFKTLGRHLAPPAGVQSPALWGTEAHLRRLFGARREDPPRRERIFNFRYRSAAHFVDVFRTWYGPVHKAFAALAGGAGRGARTRPDRAARAARTGAAANRSSCRASTSRSSSRAPEAAATGLPTACRPNLWSRRARLATHLDRHSQRGERGGGEREHRAEQERGVVAAVQRRERAVARGPQACRCATRRGSRGPPGRARRPS